MLMRDEQVQAEGLRRTARTGESRQPKHRFLLKLLIILGLIIVAMPFVGFTLVIIIDYYGLARAEANFANLKREMERELSIGTDQATVHNWLAENGFRYEEVEVSPDNADWREGRSVLSWLKASGAGLHIYTRARRTEKWCLTVRVFDVFCLYDKDGRVSNHIVFAWTP
jgi:hypothetical protein